MRYTFVVGCWLSLLLGLNPLGAQAQQHRPSWMEQRSQLHFLGASVLLGGASAGIVALLQGKPFGRGVLKGLVGGAVVYGGKRVAVEHWSGAGLLGRQVGLLGGSMINNGGTGRGTFEQVAFGFGPVRGYLNRQNGEFDWGLDVPGALAVLWGILDSGQSFDPLQSLSSGAVVFQGEETVALPGTIMYWRSRDVSDPVRHAAWLRYVLAHERVHVLQYDQTFFAVGKPTESWVAARLPDLGLPFALEFNAVSLATAVMALHIWPRHDEQPWEREASFLGRIRQ